MHIFNIKNQNAYDFINMTKNMIQSHRINMVLTDQYPETNLKEFNEFLWKKISECSLLQLIYYFYIV